MKKTLPADLELYFEDRRLKMTWGGRLLTYVLSYISYFFLTAATFTLLMSGLRWLQGIGAFLLLFLGDRLLHLYQADKPLSELPSLGRVNAASYLAPAAFSIIERAFQRAAFTGSNFFLELLGQLLKLKEIKRGLERLDVNPSEVAQKVDDFLAKSRDEDKPSSEDLRKRAEAAVLHGLAQALENKARFIGATEIFSGLSVAHDDTIGKILNLFSLDPGDLSRAMIFSLASRRFRRLRRLPASLGGFVFESRRGIRHRVMNRAWTARPTPTLDRVSYDFTDLARHEEAGFLIGHEDEYKRMVDALSRPMNPNAMLVGESGIGKETIVAHLAFQIIKDEVPPAIFDKRLVALQLSSLVAGAGPEELQERLERIVEEIAIAGNIILYIPDIHNLMRTSGTAYLSAADALVPIVSNNAFPVVGATYPKEFKEFLEPRSDFVGSFEVIRVEEISEAEAEKLLVYESLLLENKNKIAISFGAIKTAVKLAKKYFHNKFLPSSAQELLRGGVALAARRKEKILGPQRIIDAAEEKVNIPIHEAGRAEAEALLNLEEAIHRRLIDQEEATSAVSNAIREYRSGLSRPGGPIATFLFVGPTGVGKTELSKILAKIQFGSEQMMIRFDMTEYQDKQSFFRFIGSPDGRISGSLTEAVRERPYSLILLDEFEKAYPDILNLFLQVFDDGRLTDNLGRLVDFQNTIIIATSNAHSDIINEALRKGQTMDQIAEYLKRKLTDVFRPELLNRFSKVIVFKNLSAGDVQKIAYLNLDDLSGVLRAQGITITFDDETIKLISKLGYEPAFGARPLRRAIEEHIRAPLAEKILRKEIIKGGDVKVTAKNDKIEFVTAKT